MQGDLPKAGEVWGVPDQPGTWQYVTVVSSSLIECRAFSNEFAIGKTSWDEWLDTTGAVRIWPPMESIDGK